MVKSTLSTVNNPNQRWQNTIRCHKYIKLFLFAAPTPILEDLDDDDIVSIDMKGLVGQDVVIETTKADIVFYYNGWHLFVADSKLRTVPERVYKERLAEIVINSGQQDTESFVNTCIEAAVLALLLHKEPLRVQQPDKPDTPVLLPEHCT